MANTFFNLASGTLSADPGAAGVTLNSAGFSSLPTVAAPDTLRLTLDPDGALGLPEIVLVTTHTAAATSCTVTRGQETGFGGNAGLAHAIGTVWRCAVTRLDMEELAYRKVTTKGDILVASADKTTSRVGAGANTTRLVADSTQPNGVRWAAETELNLVDAKGDLTPGSADNTVAKLTVGADDTRLVADSTQATGLRWAPDTEYKIVAAKGDLVAGTADNTVAVVTVGANDTRLVADSTQASGLRYAPDTELKLVAAKGDLLVGTANDTLAVKSVGSDLTMLIADGASAGGMKWNAGVLASWVPVVTQGVGVTFTINTAKSYRSGRFVSLNFLLTVTGAGTGGSTVVISNLPYTSAVGGGVIGMGEINDASASQVYAGSVLLASTTTLAFRSILVASSNPLLGSSNFTAALAAGDTISGTCWYEASSD